MKQEASHWYYYGLLAGLLCVFVVSPFTVEGTLVDHLLNASVLVTLIFSVLVISNDKKMMLLACLFSAPLILGSMQGIIGDVIPIPPFLSSLSGATFILLIIAIMLRDMFTSTRVDTAMIVGAISLYFLIGLLWGFVYVAIFSQNPDAFSLQSHDVADTTGSLMYFSMVTLTTLGYGDITPLSAAARAMSSLEAVVGQLYLTVLVARLVGMHIAQKG